MPEAAALPAAGKLPRARTNVQLVVGAGVLLAYLGVAAVGPLFAPYPTNDQDLFNILGAPSAEHWLGTDQIGRDLLSRVIVGTRFTLAIAVVSVALALAAGTVLGLIGGYFGGRIDATVTGLIDLLLTIPELILAIAIASVVGASLTGLVIAIAATFTPQVARLVRGRVYEIREEDYVKAAITIGMSETRVLARHVLPNAITVIVIEGSLKAGQAVLIGAALGFLGLGVQPPAPEWGTMLGGGREFIEVAPHLVLAPGVAISLLVFGFNMLGDGLRDRLDPNLQA